MNSQEVGILFISSYRRKPVSSLFIEFNAYWTPVVTGETTFYETIKIMRLAYLCVLCGEKVSAFLCALCASVVKNEVAFSPRLPVPVSPRPLLNPS